MPLLPLSLSTMIDNRLLLDLIAGTSEVCVVDDNARSHAMRGIADPLPLSLPPCRWQSSPILSSHTKEKLVAGHKRSASVPLPSIPSLHSLVSPVRRRSVEIHTPNRGHLSASELLAEYLRISTQDLSILDIDGDDYGVEEERNEKEEEVVDVCDDGDLDEEDLTTVTSSSVTVSSHSVSVSSWDPPLSMTTNVKKPVRRKSLDTSSSSL